MAANLNVEVKLADHPEVKRIVLAADPSYRRKTARVMAVETIALSGTYYGGGTRSTYTAVDLVTLKAGAAPQYDPPQFGGPKKPPVCEIPVGVAVVETGYFCGKVAQAYVNVRPSNMARLLPAA